MSKIVGVIIGKFYPLHSGHIDMIKQSAAGLVDELHVVVCTNSTQTWGSLTPEDRVLSLQHAINSDTYIDVNIKIHHMDDSDMPGAEESDPDVSKVWADYLVTRFPDMDMFIGSEDYVEMMANSTGKIYFKFSRDYVSGTKCRNNTLEFFPHINAYTRSKLIKRVCVVGAESSGKSTLVRDIKYPSKFVLTTIEETARSFMIDGKLTPEHFETFALNHYSNVFLNTDNMKTAVQVVDTDLNITALYAQEYLGTNVELVDMLQKKEKYDHYIVLPPIVPFVQDGLRIQETQQERDDFYQKVLAFVIESGVPYTIINESTESERIDIVLDIIYELGDQIC